MNQSFQYPGKATAFQDHDAIYNRIQEYMWGHEAVCPHCGHVHPEVEIPNGKHLKCDNCHKRFTALDGTPLARTRLPLTKWSTALYLCADGNSVPSMKTIMKDVGVAHSFAWKLRKLLLRGLSEELGDVYCKTEMSPEEEEETVDNLLRKLLETTEENAAEPTDSDNDSR